MYCEKGIILNGNTVRLVFRCITALGNVRGVAMDYSGLYWPRVVLQP